MKCLICGEEMIRTAKNVEAIWKGLGAIFYDMDVWVCPFCTKEDYENDDLEYMYSILEDAENYEDNM